MIHLWCSFMVTLCTCSMWGPSHGCHPSPGDLLMALFRAQLCVFQPLFYTELNCSSLRFQSDFPEKCGWMKKICVESHRNAWITWAIPPHFCIPVRSLLCRYTRTSNSAWSHSALHPSVRRHLIQATTHSAFNGEVQEPLPLCFHVDTSSLSPSLHVLFRLH